MIVGCGQAADQAAQTLRRKGFSGRVIMVGEDVCYPYQRPPLSKQFLCGELQRERLNLRSAAFYDEHRVELRLGRRVEEIARRECRVRLDDGSLEPYDALLIATGTRPRPLRAEGDNLRGVHLLRTVADAERIRADLVESRHLVVIGAGYIGLEVAATARKLGHSVTVLEMADRVMSRVTGNAISSFYETEHTRHGVKIRCNTSVRAFEGDPSTGRVCGVSTEDGREYPADLVLVGIGVVVADELALACGLGCENGILVDEFCRTSDEKIYAAGDCANYPHQHYGRRTRLESVDNAVEQGTCAAQNMLGVPTVCQKIPWFWSDQYDLKMITVGLSHGHDAIVIRGAPRARNFSACYLQRGELIAVDSINSPKDQMAARKLIAARVRPRPDELENPDIPLKDLI